MGDFFRQPLRPINLGLESFCAIIIAQKLMPSLWTGVRRWTAMLS
jgi:hypothetical protein